MTVLLPEHRQIELYSKKKTLPIAEDAEAEQAAAAAAVDRLAQSFASLDAALGGAVDRNDSAAIWEKYRRLPRGAGIDKLTAEVYRTLRVIQVATRHPTGRVSVRNGLVKTSATVDYTALTIRITQAGISLLESFVAYRLRPETALYPEAYVEAMLCRYWCDIVTEIRWYYDEDQVLFQFRDPLRLNRHFRFDCDNPRMSLSEGALAFDVGAKYADPARYPIDFFVVESERLHIVPVEALSGGRIALADLPVWRARVPDGLTLPAGFRARFTREEMVPGLPMT